MKNKTFNSIYIPDNIKRLLSLMSIFFLALHLSGCVSPPKTEINQTKLQKEDVPLKTVSDKKTKTFQLDKIKVGFEHGSVIGTRMDLPWGSLGACRGTEKIKWEGSSKIENDNFYYIFYDEFKKMGYSILGDPRKMFPTPDSEKPDLAVGANIISMDYVHCGLRNDRRFSKRDMTLKVNFQFFSLRTRKVVFDIVTESEILKFKNGTFLEVFLETFRGNVQKIIADEKFNKFITSGVSDIPQFAESQLNYEFMSLASLPPSNEPLGKHINSIQSSVVKITNDDSTVYGSGFLADGRGYILTCNHVVASGNNFQVIFDSEKKYDGRVVRRNPDLDLALIKIQAVNLTPLPINRTKLNVGEAIFAMGFPLNEANASLTKGIIASYYESEGKEYIQSDVNTLPGSSGGPLLDEKGNVVGITYSGVHISDVPVGRNFFLPINMALKGLKLN